MGFYSSNIRAKKRKEILDYVITKMDLSKLLERNYGNFSGGEKQKIHFARTVIQVCASNEKEKYLFLDEPTLNLDIYYQFKILDLVQSLISDFQIGVCAILHDINQAYIYSDEIAIIKDNKIKYFGKTEEILTSEIIYDVFNVQSDYVYSSKFKRKVLITQGHV
jgi:iron complex transport system ATP-binding protein